MRNQVRVVVFSSRNKLSKTKSKISYGGYCTEYIYKKSEIFLVERPVSTSTLSVKFLFSINAALAEPCHTTGKSTSAPIHSSAYSFGRYNMFSTSASTDIEYLHVSQLLNMTNFSNFYSLSLARRSIIFSFPLSFQIIASKIQEWTSSSAIRRSLPSNAADSHRRHVLHSSSLCRRMGASGTLNSTLLALTGLAKFDSLPMFNHTAFVTQSPSTNKIYITFNRN